MGEVRRRAGSLLCTTVNTHIVGRKMKRLTNKVMFMWVCVKWLVSGLIVGCRRRDSGGRERQVTGDGIGADVTCIYSRLFTYSQQTVGVSELSRVFRPSRPFASQFMTPAHHHSRYIRCPAMVHSKYVLRFHVYASPDDPFHPFPLNVDGIQVWKPCSSAPTNSLTAEAWRVRCLLGPLFIYF